MRDGAILIVTRKFDPHADHVIGILNRRGIPRWHPARPSEETGLNIARALAALAFAVHAPAYASAYVDEAQCFGGAVPTLPGPVAVSANVNAARGTYLVTAWRQACQAAPGAFAIATLPVRQARIRPGTPSVLSGRKTSGSMKVSSTRR